MTSYAQSLATKAAPAIENGRMTRDKWLEEVSERLCQEWQETMLETNDPIISATIDQRLKQINFMKEQYRHVMGLELDAALAAL